MMTINEVSFSRPEVVAGFSVLLSLLVEISPSFLEVLLCDLHSLQVDPALERILRLRDLFQTVLLFHLRSEKFTNFSSFILLLH